MLPPRKFTLPIALLGLASASPAIAEQELAPAKYKVEASFGGEYDSNVSVEEVDVTSSESDYALTMEFGVGVEKQLSERVEWGASYDLNQTLYQEFSQVDRQTHILGTDLSVDFGRTDTDLSFFYIQARLDDERFLEMYRLSPSISGFLSRNWFVRGAYIYNDKKIENRPERDATSDSGEIDVYYFLRGLRSYLNVGYRYRDEDAVAERLDYASHGAKLRYIRRFDLLGRTNKLELAWRYEDRDYTSITPSIGEKRSDVRNRWRIDLEVPVLEQGAIQVYSGYSDNSSNYPASDYDRVIIGSRFTYRW